VWHEATENVVFGTECFILMAGFDQHGEALCAGSNTRWFSAVLEFQAASRSVFGQLVAFELQMERMK